MTQSRQTKRRLSRIEEKEAKKIEVYRNQSKSYKEKIYPGDLMGYYKEPIITSYKENKRKR